MTPIMEIVWDVLEAAKEVQDDRIIASCRRLIVANRLGWRKYADQRDIDIIMEFAE